MVEILVVTALAFAALVLFGVLAAVFSLLGWLVTLPLRIVGFLFGALGLVLVFPFLLLALVVFGVGALLFLVPFLPFAVLAWLIWALFHRRDRTSTVST